MISGMMSLYVFRTITWEVGPLAGSPELGRVLKEMRERCGISLVNAAKAIGTDRHATVSDIESGRRSVSFEESVNLAALYGVTMADLAAAMSGKGKQEAATFALPRATVELGEPDRMALARLERLAADYSRLQQVLGG